jgi:hypothetical protein
MPQEPRNYADECPHAAPCLLSRRAAGSTPRTLAILRRVSTWGEVSSDSYPRRVSRAIPTVTASFSWEKPAALRAFLRRDPNELANGLPRGVVTNVLVQ